MYSVNETSVSPLFASIKEIWVVCDFLYFECSPFETTAFSEVYQAYSIQESERATDIIICPYDSLVDYNVFHIHKDHLKNWYISVKYDINDLIAQHIKGCNPLKF
jgi:hypothetical protein